MINDIQTLLDAFSAAFRNNSLAKLTLGAYHGKEEGLKNYVLTPVRVKEGERISRVARYETRDVTAILEPGAVAEFLGEAIGPWTFRSAHLFTTEADLQLRVSKKGKTLLRRSKPTHAAPAATEHNRKKERPLEQNAPWVGALGLADSDGDIIPSASKKWRQINRFVELVRDGMERTSLAEQETVRVVDFGSGKGYLTFALHDYLTRSLSASVETTGVELRPGLVDLCNGVVATNSIERLRFLQGDIEEADTGPIDLMIALHACDTATDLALHKGITSEAEMIVSAPCCHKEVRRLMKTPDVLSPILRYGKHLEREAEMLTDTIRALLLEIHGYSVRIAEFVPIEHTPKNSLIIAVRSPRQKESEREEARKKLSALKEFYGVEGQRLEVLLG